MNQEYEVYLAATPEECDAIRDAFQVNREFEDLLLAYVYDVVEKLQSTKDVKWLERGLVGASLENSGRDYRDTLLSLKDLHQAAKDAGINPDSYYKKASLLASREKPRGGTTSVSTLLNNFIGVIDDN